MKRLIFTALSLWISLNSYAQMFEAGFFAGGSNFVGDVGATNYFNPNRLALGAVFKYNINPRMALRGNYNYFDIHGDDAKSDNVIRNQRNFKFTNTLHEFAVGLEYNFFEYDLSSYKKRSTPYILVQLGAVNHQAARTTNLNGDVVFTRKTSLSIPMGLGYKSILFGKFAFAIEARVHYALTDDLDYTTTDIPDLNFGGTSDDWYMFTGVSIVYTFGRPPCYADPR